MIDVILTGNVGQNAKTATAKNLNFVNFSVADNNRTTTADGEVIEVTTWVNVSYKAQNETAAQKLAAIITKGCRVLVKGKPHVKMYEDNKGKTAAALEIRANFIEMQAGAKDKPDTESAMSKAGNEDFNN